MGRDKQEKYKVSMGLAFNEDNEMKMLGRMAKEGWIFYAYSNLGYKFKKGEPQELAYCMDTHILKKDEDEAEQYFDIFKDAGWIHVCSAGGFYHFFSASPGTKPIYTDKETLAEKYMKAVKAVDKSLVVLGIVLLSSLLLGMFINRFWDNEAVTFIIAVITGGSLGLLGAMIVTGAALRLRIKRLRQL